VICRSRAFLLGDGPEGEQPPDRRGYLGRHLREAQRLGPGDRQFGPVVRVRQDRGGHHVSDIARINQGDPPVASARAHDAFRLDRRGCAVQDRADLTEARLPWAEPMPGR
jgi:hypothetical protein